MRSKKHSCTAVLNGMAKPLWRGEVCPFAQKYAPTIRRGGKKGLKCRFFLQKRRWRKLCRASEKNPTVCPLIFKRTPH